MYDRDLRVSFYWMISVIIGMCVNLLIFDLIFALVGLKFRGYYFDYVLNENYSEILDKD